MQPALFDAAKPKFGVETSTAGTDAKSEPVGPVRSCFVFVGGDNRTETNNHGLQRERGRADPKAGGQGQPQCAREKEEQTSMRFIDHGEHDPLPALMRRSINPILEILCSGLMA